MTTPKTRQGQYLGRVVRISITINPDTEADLLQKWQTLLSRHEGSQAKAIKALIREAKP